MWQLTPASWSVAYVRNMLGGGYTPVVKMNNADVVSRHATAAEASLEAARMNYAHGSYRRPHKFGLDGVE